MAAKAVITIIRSHEIYTCDISNPTDFGSVSPNITIIFKNFELLVPNFEYLKYTFSKIVHF